MKCVLIKKTSCLSGGWKWDALLGFAASNAMMSIL